MSIPIILAGGDVDLQGDLNGSAHVLLYDGNGNPLANAANTQVTTTKHGVAVGGFDEDIFRVLRVGRLGSLALNRVNQPVFQDLVDGAAVNAQQWASTVTTMTITQASRVVTLNANSTLTTTTVAALTSLANFVKVRESILRLSARVRLNWTANGAVMHVGFGVAATTAEQLTNGIVMRVTSAGAIHIVVAQGSADIVVKDTGVSCGTGPTQVNPSRWYDLDLYVLDDAVRLVILHSDGDTSTAPVVDSTLSFSVSSVADSILRGLPALMRVVNVTGVSTASQLMFSGAVVMTQDIDEQRPFQHAMARAGRNTLLNPGSGAQLANYSNSAAPASAALSNTAAGYTTLGGLWQFAAVAGAETDYALFGFVVPTGYTLHVTGVRIDTGVTGAAVATTPTMLQWFLSRSSAATLASNTFRKALGMQSLPVGAAIGSLAAPIDWQTDTPFVVDSAQTFHLALRMPVATATASSIIRGVAVIDGYLE